MANIYSYPQIGELATNDTIAISDFSNGNKTQSVTIGQLSSYFNTGLVQQTSVTLTSAQLLSLNGGGSIELIAAPGINKVIAPISIAGFLDFNTTAYNFSGSYLGINIKSGTTGSSLAVIAEADINSTSDKYFLCVDFGLNGTLEANGSLSIIATTETVTQGDSPLKINILYRIVDFS
jgi:hypothetical protein